MRDQSREPSDEKARAIDVPTRSTDHEANEGHLNRIDWFRGLPAWLVVAVSAAIFMIVFVVDLVTGPDLQLLIFYLVPVLAMTWRFDLLVGEITAGVVVVGGGVANVVGPDPVSELTAVWNSSARFVFLSLMVGLVHRQRAVLDHQRALAATDPLTGVLNRRAFYESCADAFSRARRQPADLSLVYFDVNGLKIVNDREGHGAGDRLLAELARIVTGITRTTDAFARMGGDEFAVLLPNTDQAAAALFADRLRATLATDGFRPMTVSMGIVVAHAVPDDVESLVHQADELMYEAKRGSRGVKIASFAEASSASSVPRPATRRPTPPLGTVGQPR